MINYEQILLSGEYVTCDSKEEKDIVEKIAKNLIKNGIHPKNGNRIKGVVISSSNPWYIKVMF